MELRKFVTPAAAAVAFVAILLAAMLNSPPRVKATGDDDDNGSDSRIQRGLDIAPVHLNLEGKNRALVGLGSYIVNAAVPCNECHGAGPALNQFLPGDNPYFGQAAVINPATYLGGGRSFGAPVPGSAVIISRNLTPNKTGLPEGGRTFGEFVQIMRTGVDLDHLHPTCATGPSGLPIVNTSCIPAPFNGDLLQTMPWPGLRNLTDHDLRAIYEYLSAVPCVAGPPAPSPLHNDCQ
ncbi:MAG TPA: hypothetical protein VK805_09180 [Candidatus Baltobacteraceae bacterium]|nr:hypothetical protein [Candidatus Baltobacteraceae bacterium]